MVYMILYVFMFLCFYILLDEVTYLLVNYIKHMRYYRCVRLIEIRCTRNS